MKTFTKYDIETDTVSELTLRVGDIVAFKNKFDTDMIGRIYVIDDYSTSDDSGNVFFGIQDQRNKSHYVMYNDLIFDN